MGKRTGEVRVSVPTSTELCGGLDNEEEGIVDIEGTAIGSTLPELDSKARVSRAKGPKRERDTGAVVSDLSKPPASKKRKTATKLQVGDRVCIHTDTLMKRHVPCRITEVVGQRYRLCCNQGVLQSCYTRSQVTPLSSSYQLSLDG